MTGPAGAYENLQGRIHGELDPAHPQNRIIQDIDARTAERARAGGVRRHLLADEAGRPLEGQRRARVLRGQPRERRRDAERRTATSRSSAAGRATSIPTATNQTIQVPVARHPDGAAVTGPVLARFSDLPAGTTTASIRLGSMGTAAYPPETLDTSRGASHLSHARKRRAASAEPIGTVAAGDWAFADCRERRFPDGLIPRASA